MLRTRLVSMVLLLTAVCLAGSGCMVVSSPGRSSRSVSSSKHDNGKHLGQTKNKNKGKGK